MRIMLKRSLDVEQLRSSSEAIVQVESVVSTPWSTGRT